MRWTGVFVSISTGAFAIVLLTLVFGWSGWLLALLIVLVLPIVVGIAIALRHAVRWTSVLVFLSAIALLAAAAGQLLGSPSTRSWFLLIWIALLPAGIIALLRHPMRRPGLALFVAFWAMLAVGWLFVLQILQLADFVQVAAFTSSASWPLAALGIWFVLASANGYAAKPFGAVIDSLGLITGAAFIAISISTWADMPVARQAFGVIASLGYSLWISGIGWVLLDVENPLRAVVGQRVPAREIEASERLAEARPAVLGGDL